MHPTRMTRRGSRIEIPPGRPGNASRAPCTGMPTCRPDATNRSITRGSCKLLIPFLRLPDCCMSTLCDAHWADPNPVLDRSARRLSSRQTERRLDNANGGSHLMSATGLEVFDTTIQKTNIWLNDLE